MQLLTTEEAASRLSLHPETVRRLLRDGDLRGVRMGSRAWRIEEGELDAYIERLKAAQWWKTLTRLTHKAPQGTPKAAAGS